MRFRTDLTNRRSQPGEMKRDWLEFARTLADGARATLEEDRRRLEATRSKKSQHQLQPKGLVDPR